MDTENKPFVQKEKEEEEIEGQGRQKRMTQTVRLEKSRKWVAVYAGDNILKDYRKKFATDRMQTIDDLQKLGLTFTEDEIAKENARCRLTTSSKEQKGKT